MAIQTTYDPIELETFCTEIFHKAGVPREHAATISASLVQADLRGVFSHGVVRTSIYVERLRQKMVDPYAEIEVVSDSGAVTLIDGHNNYGAVVGTKALEVSMERAKKHGVSVVGVKRSNHFGTCAYYALQAVKENLILISISNAPQTMPPTGGIRPFLGTNPFSIGIPTGTDVPFIMDMATSVAARGKIIVAAQKGESIPYGWAIDKEGNPTTDAEAALEGAVLPFGGAKGYAIAMFIDILSGVLTGAGFGKYVNNLYDNWEEPQNVGHLFITIDINRFMPVDEFKKRIDQYISELKAEPKAPGVKELFIPGEIEHRLMEKMKRSGIPLPEKVIRELQQLGEQYGIPFPSSKHSS